MTRLQKKILRLKKEKRATILAHFYQRQEVQEIADEVGDSFALAQKAQQADCDAIVLCGVRFMAESAKILNPSKKVYLPNPGAGCPMADMVTPEDVRALREKYPEAAVVCYVNSSAAVKAVSDVCCTSSSAERIVRALPQKQIIFVPDENLGSYCASLAPEKEFILYRGFCPTHNMVTREHAEAARAAHPNARIAVHPECRPEVREYADYIGSTAGILKYVKASDAEEFVIGTECGVQEILQRELPEKRIISITDDFVCPDMKKTTLEDVLRALSDELPEIELPEEEMRLARGSLERMISM
jgi:quinolinate synthase